MQSVPITPKVESLNPIHGEVYSIQHYVIKFVSDLRQVGGFIRVLRLAVVPNITSYGMSLDVDVAQRKKIVKTKQIYNFNLIGFCCCAFCKYIIFFIV
jgi:hypothetical protein